MSTQSTKKQTAKHTPGPWELGPDIRSRGDLVYRMVLAGKKRLCAVSVYGGRAGTNQPTFSEEEVVANGHLIAAAPDLLAACRTALLALDRAPIRVDPKLTDLLAAAIARAEGGGA